MFIAAVPHPDSQKQLCHGLMEKCLLIRDSHTRLAIKLFGKVVLVASSHKEIQVITCLSQSFFIPADVLLKLYIACRKISKCQPYSNKISVHANIHTLVKFMLTVSHTTYVC